jgi:hypothetical protein
MISLIKFKNLIIKKSFISLFLFKNKAIFLNSVLRYDDTLLFVWSNTAHLSKLDSLMLIEGSTQVKINISSMEIHSLLLLSFCNSLHAMSLRSMQMINKISSYCLFNLRNNVWLRSTLAIAHRSNKRTYACITINHSHLRSLYSSTLSCRKNILTIPNTLNVQKRFMQSSGKVATKTITTLSKTNSPSGQRSFSFLGKNTQIPSKPLTKNGTLSQGEYSYHNGACLVSCDKPDCNQLNCATGSNACGISQHDFQQGNIPQKSPTNANMVVETIGNLTSNPAPKGVPQANIVQLSTTNAIGQNKPQHFVKETSSIIEKTVPPTEPKLNSYLQQSNIHNKLANNLPADCNLNNKSQTNNTSNALNTSNKTNGTTT